MRRSLVTAAFVVTAASSLGLWACSSSSKDLKVQKEAYAKLQGHRTFEYELPVVWKGVEKVVSERGYQVTKTLDGNPREHILETDWVVEESQDKYHKYMINGSPRQKRLRARFKYVFTAKTVVGGTDLGIKTNEEIEKLKEDGSPAGWSGVSEKEQDSSRAAELLERINLAILGDR